MPKENSRSKQPNDIISVKQHPATTKAFLDILDVVSAQVNAEDDDPDNLEYTIELRNSKEFSRNKNFFSKIRREGAKDILHCAYNYFNLTGEEHGGSVYVSGFRWKNENLMDEITIVLSLDYKRMLNDSKGMVYFSPAETIAMSSRYGRTMYLRLLKQKNRAKMSFRAKGSLHGERFTYYETLEQFREILGIPDSYKLSNIKRLCQTIISDIDANTQYTAEVYYNVAKLPATPKPVTTHIAWLLIKKPEDIVEPEEYEIFDAGENKDYRQETLTNEEGTLAVQIMNLTGLDWISSASIVSNARKHGVGQDIVLDTCRYCLTQKTDDLGRYINGLVSRGGYSPKRENNPSTTITKNKRSGKDPAKTKFNDFPQRQYTPEQIEAIKRGGKKK